MVAKAELATTAAPVKAAKTAMAIANFFMETLLKITHQNLCSFSILRNLRM